LRHITAAVVRSPTPHSDSDAASAFVRLSISANVRLPASSISAISPG
jgi:hypothetical protein